MSAAESARWDETEPWTWSAEQIRRATGAGAISAQEVTRSCLGRIEAVNPTLNALVEVFAEEALAAAAEADDRRAAGEELGALHGVPVAVKVNSDQRGHATTNGIAAFKDAVAEEDSPQVSALRRAGAVIVGRSNTPAFSYRWFTDNDLHGRTLNPWDAARTPGGSSGGASAAVASGMVPIAHGNDIGGSVRYPAYACGVVGLRPTVGRVPGLYGPPGVDPALSVQLMLVQGPLARSVGDVGLALEAMSAFDSRDPFAVPGDPSPAPVAGPTRVGFVRAPSGPNDAPVDEALDAAARWLGDAGYVVEEVELPLLEEARRLWWLLAMEEFRQIMPLVREVGDAGMNRAAELYYEVAAEWWGPAPSLADYMNGYARRGSLVRMLGVFMERYPLVLLPVSGERPFEQDADLQGVDRTRQVMAAQASMMAIPMLGFPAMSVPTGAPDGVPSGVQLLGRRFDEAGVLAAADVIEARAGTFTPIDPR